MGPASVPARHPSHGLQRVLVVMDFDGTITTADCMEMLMQRHVPTWPALTAAMRNGEIPEVQALERALQMLHLPRDRVLTEFVKFAELRRDFRDFLSSIVVFGARAVVISVGFREAIETVWTRENLPSVPVYAAELRGDAERGFQLDLNESFGSCPVCGPGRCKGAVVRSLRGQTDVVVAFGDGTRDLCMAREADCIFARGRLTDACRLESIPTRPFEDFTTASQEIATLLAVTR